MLALAPAAHAKLASQMSAGLFSACLVTLGGAVECWGLSSSGMLGTTAVGHSDVPTPVTGLTASNSYVSVGFQHACAVTAAGGVKCWGENSDGQLGDGTTTSSPTPVDVIGLSSGVSRVALGYQHSCALTSAGALKCWGANYSGQLGDGTTTDSPTPVDVVGLSSGIVELVAAATHNCARTSAGGLKCWGSNASGELGTGSTTASSLPLDVSGLTAGVTAVATGFLHTCAITSSGGLKCWGANLDGILGDGGTTDSSLPIDVSGLTTGVAAVKAGVWHTCAITELGVLKCWGRNLDGQLGDGTTTPSLTPIEAVAVSTPVAQLNPGGAQTCAISSSGGVECWGSDFYGALGSGNVFEPSPAGVVGLTAAGSASALSVGTTSACAVTTSGAAQCWGTATGSAVPVAVSGLGSGVVTIAASESGHACALTAAGGVKCWGSNDSGQLGDGTTTESSTPVDVAGLTSGVSAIAIGGIHSCALTSTGGVKCWGENANGRLGDGTTTDSSTPVDVFGLTSGVSAIATGDSHSCALTTSGAVKCWGSNPEGRLGDGTTTGSATPVDVSGLTAGISAVALGSAHSCAITVAGGVKCWGENGSGELGDGTTTDSTVPVDPSGLTGGIASLGLGDNFSCAVTAGGALKCWGVNRSGQLGIGSTSYYGVTTPTDVPALATGVGAVEGGLRTACALLTDGGLRCWGGNPSGQLGNGYPGRSSVPVPVVGLDRCGLAAKQKITLGRLTQPPGNHTLSMSGEMTLPFPFTPALNPIANGARLGLWRTLPGGAILDDVVIPNGAYDSGTKKGWKVNAAGTVWTYVNRPNDLPSGITQVKLTAVAATPGLVKYTVKGKGGSYAPGPLTASDLPLVGQVSFEAGVATEGQCGVARFAAPAGPAPACKLNLSGSTVTCR